MKLGRRVWLVIIGAAAVLLVIVAVPWRQGTETSAAPAPAEPPPDDPGPPGDTVTTEQLAEQGERSALLTWGRNPFQSLAPAISDPAPIVEPHQTRRLRLTGVSIYDQDRRAIIDHEVVGEGDRLTSGHVVQEITSTAVTLLLDQEEVTLRLGD